MAARWRWLFSWSGRISRASYLYAWLFYGVCMGTLVFSGYWAALDGSIHPRFVVTAEHGINLACLSAAMLVPCMGLVFRRLRDLDLGLLWAVPVYAASLGCAETGFYHVYGWARAAAGGNASLLICGVMFFCCFCFVPWRRLRWDVFPATAGPAFPSEPGKERKERSDCETLLLPYAGWGIAWAVRF